MKLSLDAPLDEIERMNRKHLDVTAEHHVDMVSEYRMGILAPEIDRFHENLSGTRILDVGCGIGRCSLPLLGFGLEYTGIDISLRALKLARELFPDIRLAQMSFRSLAFADAQFDALWCCCALWYEPKRNMGNVLREFHRVIVPGGMLYSIEPVTGSSNEEIFEGPTRSDDDFAYCSTWFPEEFADALTDAGFSVEIFPDPENGAASYLARK